MIEMRSIHKTYKRKNITTEALKEINLQVEEGDIFGVIGYSGAGKSTLVRLVNYLERPTGGKVIVDGQELDKMSDSKLRAMKKQIGMIFQHFNLLESKTIFDNVAIPLILSKKPKAEIKKRVMELLEFIGLSDKAKSYPKELSGGQKQRVGIARALASNPKILLCDEATSALDPQTTQSILQLLKRVNQEYNITVMIITHEMSVIQEVCNRVAVMEAGEIIEQGSVLDVFGHPQHPTTKSFVQTVIHNNIPESVKRTLKQTDNSRVFRLEIQGDSASEPIVNQLMKNYEVEVNILFANMTEIQETTLVIMYLQFEGAGNDVEKAIQFLVEKGANMEEVTA
ncbi:methionine ABC transporter ATP-binding protein [Gracilibacillus oryzae]|uniref:Methionine ABC transporter ATP-binding protein n=1 Tax=Gracilibacillus oryzae TaxID=1672701 RepID=A0A7C8KMS4_9BACI|nr:methionine ABC transporter ATP-binding protein [Gracilibacillus oryzae]KAB8126664.1 methionine ABC transporter ATP-binding protein [Gracilibacillus oryzae]